MGLNRGYNWHPDEGDTWIGNFRVWLVNTRQRGAVWCWCHGEEVRIRGFGFATKAKAVAHLMDYLGEEIAGHLVMAKGTRR